MEGICRLCEEEKELVDSHIMPKMFFKKLKRATKAKSIIEVSKPYDKEQDGLKLPFLCNECEKLFNEYETYFSNKFLKKASDDIQHIYDTKDDRLRYLILSIAWRYLKYTYESDEKVRSYNTKKELEMIEDVIENWEGMLYNKKIQDIRNIQMHFIPINKLRIFDNNPEAIYDNIFMDFRSHGKSDSFEYGFVYIKIPYFILLCTVWGKTSNMKQFLVGKKIITKDSNLPNWLIDLISIHLQVSEDVYKEISNTK
ncbi:hypothetical protein ACQPUZ_08515 [Clostridium tertium]